AAFRDVSHDFESQLGFVPRTDIRALSHYGSLVFRPEWGPFLAISPRGFEALFWDHEGERVYMEHGGGVLFDLKRQTTLNVWYNGMRERLRPEDYATIASTRLYSYRNVDVYFSSSAFRAVTLTGDVWMHATAVNYNPAPGAQPEV